MFQVLKNNRIILQLKTSFQQEKQKRFKDEHGGKRWGRRRNIRREEIEEVSK